MDGAPASGSAHRARSSLADRAAAYLVNSREKNPFEVEGAFG